MQQHSYSTGVPYNTVNVLLIVRFFTITYLILFLSNCTQSPHHSANLIALRAFERRFALHQTQVHLLYYYTFRTQGHPTQNINYFNLPRFCVSSMAPHLNHSCLRNMPIIPSFRVLSFQISPYCTLLLSFVGHQTRSRSKTMQESLFLYLVLQKKFLRSTSIL